MRVAILPAPGAFVDHARLTGAARLTGCSRTAKARRGPAVSGAVRVDVALRYGRADGFASERVVRARPCQAVLVAVTRISRGHGAGPYRAGRVGVALRRAASPRARAFEAIRVARAVAVSLAGCARVAIACPLAISVGFACCSGRDRTRARGARALIRRRARLPRVRRAREAIVVGLARALGDFAQTSL